LADRVVRGEQRLVARLSPDDGKLARPGELRIVGIDAELLGRSLDVGQAPSERVAPILRRAQREGRPHELVTVRVIDLELLACADRVMVPVVDTIAVEI